MDVIPHDTDHLFTGLPRPYLYTKVFPHLNLSPTNIIRPHQYVKYEIDNGDPVKAKLFTILYDIESTQPGEPIQAHRLLWLAVEIEDYPPGMSEPEPAEILDKKMCRGKGAYSLTCPRHNVLLLTVARP